MDLIKCKDVSVIQDIIHNAIRHQIGVGGGSHNENSHTEDESHAWDANIVHATKVPAKNRYFGEVKVCDDGNDEGITRNYTSEYRHYTKYGGRDAPKIVVIRKPKIGLDDYVF